MSEHTAEKDAHTEWLDRSVTLRDYFDDWTTMRVAEPQPHYGLVQLNVERKGVLISVDVKRADLLAALDTCVTPREAAKERVARRKQLRKEAAERGRLLPADYREHIRRQFERAEAEARFIVTGVIPPEGGSDA